MVRYTVLRDIGDTLKKILKEHIPELPDDNCFTYKSPADMEKPTTPVLSIFLYQIAANSHFRNLERETADVNHLQFAPAVVDLYYLFTPYAQNQETELIMVESILKLFHDHQVLTPPMLQGKLLECGNQRINLVPNNLSFDEINKLWERFPNKPFKLSLAYMLTPVYLPSEKEPEPITRVREKVVEIYRMAKKNDDEQ